MWYNIFSCTLLPKYVPKELDMNKLYSFLLSAVILSGVFGLGWKTTRVEGVAYEIFSQSNSLRENFDQFRVCAEKARQREKDCNESSLKILFLQRDSIISANWQSAFDNLEAKPHWAWTRGGDYNSFHAAIAAYGRNKLRNECVPAVTYMFTEGRTTFNFDHRYRCSGDPRPPSGGLSFLLPATNCAPAWT